MTDQIEISVSEDDGDSLGANVRVLPDGRLQIETDEAGFTLSLADSHLIASAILEAMGQ